MTHEHLMSYLMYKHFSDVLYFSLDDYYFQKPSVSTEPCTWSVGTGYGRAYTGGNLRIFLFLLWILPLICLFHGNHEDDNSKTSEIFHRKKIIPTLYQSIRKMGNIGRNQLTHFDGLQYFSISIYKCTMIEGWRIKGNTGTGISPISG